VIKRWEIYKANLDPTIGSEQGKSRPVVIISENNINDLLNTVNIIPLTSRKNDRRIYPNEVLIEQSKFGLINESIVLCQQIRTIDKRRLLHKYGEITDIEIQDKIIESLCFQLGIQ
jgi:mRNA interferase MazF